MWEGITISFIEYLKDTLSEPNPKYIEGLVPEVRFKCPFCNEMGNKTDDYKLYVKNTPLETNLWYCHRCGSKGNPLSFVSKYEKLNFNESVELLKEYDITFSDIKKQYSELTEQEILYLQLQDEATGIRKKPVKELKKETPMFLTNYKSLRNNYMLAESEPFINYLLNRGISKEVIATHEIGYVLDEVYELNEESKFYIHNHLVFITQDINGKPVYWNTRSIEREPRLRTLNAISSLNELGKSDVIYNLNRSIKGDLIVITEGVFDALTLPNDIGVSIFGKTLSNKQEKLLLDNIKPSTHLFVMLDNDAFKNAITIAGNLYKNHKNTYIVLPFEDGGKDINDMGTEQSFKHLTTNYLRATPQNLLYAAIN